jgi:hypothetical protein
MTMREVVALKEAADDLNEGRAFCDQPTFDLRLLCRADGRETFEVL